MSRESEGRRQARVEERKAEVERKKVREAWWREMPAATEGDDRVSPWNAHWADHVQVSSIHRGGPASASDSVK